MNYPNDECVLFFVKYPEKGRVKRRLSAHLDEAITVELYKNFILDSLSTLEKLGIDYRICFYPDNSQEKFIQWLGTQYSYIPQIGEDLGQRMKNGFVKAFAEGFRRVIAIGSDSPDLPDALIKEAFLFLKTHAAVIGPCFDGGYYLIGFKIHTFLSEVFEGINWGTDRVFPETLNILGKASYDIHILPKWRDVDTFSDLKDLFQRNRGTKFSLSKTISYLLKHQTMFL